MCESPEGYSYKGFLLFCRLFLQEPPQILTGKRESKKKVPPMVLVRGGKQEPLGIPPRPFPLPIKTLICQQKDIAREHWQVSL